MRNGGAGYVFSVVFGHDSGLEHGLKADHSVVPVMEKGLKSLVKFGMLIV